MLWDEKPLARVQKISGLKRTIAVTEHRDGAAPGGTTKAPGHVTYHPVTLERAVTGDGRFRDLADAAAGATPDAGARGTLLVELQDETGTPVLQCSLHHAWVSSYEAFADLDVQSDGPAIERVVIEYDTWRIVSLQRSDAKAKKE